MSRRHPVSKSGGAKHGCSGTSKAIRGGSCSNILLKPPSMKWPRSSFRPQRVLRFEMRDATYWTCRLPSRIPHPESRIYWSRNGPNDDQRRYFDIAVYSVEVVSTVVVSKPVHCGHGIMDYSVIPVSRRIIGAATEWIVGDEAIAQTRMNWSGNQQCDQHR